MSHDAHDEHMRHEDLIGTVEAARLIGRSPRTIHRLVHSGVLAPAVVAPGGNSGVYLFKRSDIELHAALGGSAPLDLDHAPTALEPVAQ